MRTQAGGHPDRRRSPEGRPTRVQVREWTVEVVGGPDKGKKVTHPGVAGARGLGPRQRPGAHRSDGQPPPPGGGAHRARACCCATWAAATAPSSTGARCCRPSLQPGDKVELGKTKLVGEAGRARHRGGGAPARTRFGELVGASEKMRCGVRGAAPRRPRGHEPAHRGRDRHRQGAGGARGAPALGAAARPLQGRGLQPHHRGDGGARAVRRPARRRGRGQRAAASSRRPRAAPSSWTRWASCRCRSSPSCCACWRRARCPRWTGEPEPVDVRVIASTAPQPGGGRAPGPLPRGPLLPAGGGEGAPAAPAHPARGHPRAGPAPARRRCSATFELTPQTLSPLRGLRLAGQRARAAQRARARRADAGDGQHQLAGLPGASPAREEGPASPPPAWRAMVDAACRTTRPRTGCSRTSSASTSPR